LCKGHKHITSWYFLLAVRLQTKERCRPRPLHSVDGVHQGRASQHAGRQKTPLWTDYDRSVDRSRCGVCERGKCRYPYHGTTRHCSFPDSEGSLDPHETCFLLNSFTVFTHLYFDRSVTCNQRLRRTTAIHGSVSSLLSPITYFRSTVAESIRTESSRWVLGDTVSVELVTAN
jgi:hypothetical protein